MHIKHTHTHTHNTISVAVSVCLPFWLCCESLSLSFTLGLQTPFKPLCLSTCSTSSSITVVHIRRVVASICTSVLVLVNPFSFPHLFPSFLSSLIPNNTNILPAVTEAEGRVGDTRRGEEKGSCSQRGGLRTCQVQRHVSDGGG